MSRVARVILVAAAALVWFWALDGLARGTFSPVAFAVAILDTMVAVAPWGERRP